MTKIRLLLRELRTSHDLSQEELARALNLSRQSIISLERGEYLPSSPVLFALIEFFNCDLAQLVEGIRLQQTAALSSDLLASALEPTIDDVEQASPALIENPLAHALGALNVYESTTDYRVTVQAAGYAEANLTIELSDQILTITGQKAAALDRPVYQEWHSGQFSRTVRFPSAVASDQVAAKLADGILTVTAPKIEPIKPIITKVEVNKKLT